MFGRGVRPTIRNGNQAANRAGEDDLPGSPLVDELANESLRQLQRGEEVALEHAPKQLHRDFRDRAAFSNRSIVDQGVDVPVQGVLYVVGMQEIEFFDSKVLDTKR